MSHDSVNLRRSPGNLVFDDLPHDSDAGGLELHTAKKCCCGVLGKQKSSPSLGTHLGISRALENSSLCLFSWVLGLRMTVLENIGIF